MNSYGVELPTLLNSVIYVSNNGDIETNGLYFDGETFEAMLKINTEYDQPIFKTITIKKSPFYKQSPGICVFKSEFEADRVIPAGS